MVEQWLAWLAAGNVAGSTLRLRRCLIGVFADEYDLDTATGDDVQEFLASRPGGAWSKASYLSTLRSYYKWAYLSGRIDRDPTSLTHAIRVPPGVPRPVPEIVLARALMHADYQTRFMILLGAYAGLRRSEIAAFHSRAVGDGVLTIRGKGGRTRRIPIHPRLIPYLDFQGWAFPSPRRPGWHVTGETVCSHVAAALGNGWTTHCLRHRFATRCYHGAHDLRAVQQLLGHASPDTTAAYVGIDDDALTAAVLAVA